MFLFFPGRHLLTTKFQESYLTKVLAGETGGENFTHIIFAVTSANQENSRYNPLPFYTRAIGLDRFAKSLKPEKHVRYSIVPVPHCEPSENFASLTLKEAQEYFDGSIVFTPQNTVILCSTEALIWQYKKLGYRILAAEFDEKSKSFTAKTPIAVLKDFVAGDSNLLKNSVLQKELSSAAGDFWTDFPEVPKKILRIWRDPLLTETGSLTETRNYGTYAYGMGADAVMDYKYADMKSFILPGKIADEGCADGALIMRLARDFTDSDIIGIEITSEFVARCKERQRAGDFGGTFVHIHQRNLMDKIFEDNSINTTLCNSTTHELWSYGDGEKSLTQYLVKKYAQTRSGGRLVIRDVVGPENKNEEVYMWVNDKDGKNAAALKDFSDQESLTKHLNSLSTYGRFLRFANDFLSDRRRSKKRGPETKIRFKEKKIKGKMYIVLKLKDAAEFMAKKDYTENWKSELNEEFCFWSFSEWKKHLSDAGFGVVENPNKPDFTSRAYSNSWIVKNRFKNKVSLFKISGKKLEPVSYPVTNMILVGEKLK